MTVEDEKTKLIKPENQRKIKFSDLFEGKFYFEKIASIKIDNMWGKGIILRAVNINLEIL